MEMRNRRRNRWTGKSDMGNGGMGKVEWERWYGKGAIG